jgi:hypothetical protein
MCAIVDDTGRAEASMSRGEIVKTRTSLTVAILAITGILLASIPASAAWTAYVSKSGGVAITGVTGDCHYTYDNYIPGGNSSVKGYGWSVNNGGCNKVRARTMYQDGNWAGWTQWVEHRSIAESPKRSYSMLSGHQVDN